MAATPTLTTLYSFGGVDGANPAAGMIADAAGDLFGTTVGGGANNEGTVFELVKDSTAATGYTQKTLFSFNGSNGGTPYVGLGPYAGLGLIADAEGDLFGTTFTGGANGLGTAFEITNSGFVVDKPTALPDRANAKVGGPAAKGNVLSNDTDRIAGESLTVTAVNGNANLVGSPIGDDSGTLTLNKDGTYTYAASPTAILPSSGVIQDIFTYTEHNNNGRTASSTLTVVVTAPGMTYTAFPAGATYTAGNGKNPILDGSAGQDTLSAGHGAAALIGGPGDILSGGNGADTFVFNGDFGQDTITNYKVNKDSLQLDKSAFGDLVSMILDGDIKQSGTSTIITDPHNPLDTITLNNVSASVLESKGHFSFV